MTGFVLASRHGCGHERSADARKASMKGLEALRFLLELCAVAALAIAGASASWVLAILLPLALIIFWGRFIAPKAARRLRDPLRLGIEIVIFTAVGTSLAIAGRPIAGVALAVLSIAVALALRATGSRA
jgi:hypothetical protein